MRIVVYRFIEQEGRTSKCPVFFQLELVEVLSNLKLRLQGDTEIRKHSSNQRAVLFLWVQETFISLLVAALSAPNGLSEKFSFSW
jgi:hypothetical protein